MRKMGGAAVFAAFDMAVAGGGGGSFSVDNGSSKARSPDRRESAGGSPSAVRSINPAHDFTVAPIGARAYTLSERRGCVALVYCMAGWRLTCFPEAQAQARIHEEHGPRGVDGIVLDVDPTENERGLLRFEEQHSDVVSNSSRRMAQS